MPQSNTHTMPQDWNTVTLRGKGKHIDQEKQRQAIGSGNSETRDKFDGTTSSAMRKLDDATEGGKQQRINPKIKEAIIKGRSARKLTQKDLANRAQVQPTMIQQYENGKAKADAAVLRKIGNVLGCRLTGKEFGNMNI
jgi:putative transcription factor